MIFHEPMETMLGVAAVNIYGLSEIIGPGVANEYREVEDGSQISEDHFIVEVIDPKTAKPAADGEPGKLVFTTRFCCGSEYGFESLFWDGQRFLGMGVGSDR